MNAPVRSVWLVDDDEDDLMLLQTAFKTVAPDLQINTLHDGDELLPLLERTYPAPNLIVLDLNMLRTGGLQALAQIRAITPFGQLPVVVLTTSSNPMDRRNSEQLGASGYHLKPDSFGELTRLAEQLNRQWVA